MKADVRRAFTLTELLTVLVVLTLITAVMLPVMAGGRLEAKRAQCADNMRKLTLSLQMYAYDNNDRLPSGSSGGTWAWDVSSNLTTQLGILGAQRDQFYCPANPDQNNDGLWNWTEGYR